MRSFVKLKLFRITHYKSKLLKNYLPPELPPELLLKLRGDGR